jgi:hypothetical protein
MAVGTAPGIDPIALSAFRLGFPCMNATVGSSVRWSVRVLARVHPLERAAGERMAAAVLEDAALQPLLRASGRVGLKRRTAC